MDPQTVGFGEAFINFFTQFLGFSFVFESVGVIFLALQLSGRFKKERKSILWEILTGLILLILTILFANLGYSLSAATMPTNSPLFIIILMHIPSIVYLAVFSKGMALHRILRILFYLSFTYLVTEISHHWNVLFGSRLAGNPVAREVVFSIPFLVLLGVGIAVAKLKIHHVRKAFNSLMIMCFLTWSATFTLGVFSSLLQFMDENLHGLMLLFVLLLAAVDFWAYYMYYHVDKTNRVKAILEAQAQLNSAATLMLKMNEESIKRTTMARHDLKNTLAFVSELVKQGEYQKAIDFLEDSEKQLDGPLPIVDCGNPVVSSIMNLERKKAEVEGVDLRYRLVVPPSLPIQDTVLCSLLTNIIDNAIEGTKASKKEGYVDFSMILNRSLLRIRCINPTCLEKVSHRSTKSEPGHGYGTAIIKNIVADLDGYVEFSIANGSFSVDALIGLNMPQEAAEQ